MLITHYNMKVFDLLIPKVLECLPTHLMPGVTRACRSWASRSSPSAAIILPVRVIMSCRAFELEHLNWSTRVGWMLSICFQKAPICEMSMRSRQWRNLIQERVLASVWESQLILYSYQRFSALLHLKWVYLSSDYALW